MTELETTETALQQPAALLTLRDIVSNVSFKDLAKLRTETDMLIVAAMRDIIRTPSAQGAAAEAARDCHALAADLRDSGREPSPAGMACVEAAKDRALASLDRMIEAIAKCDPRIIESEKGRRSAYPRSSSVVMKKRSSYTRPAPEPVAAEPS